jgi:hypothetical protein
LSPDRKFLLKLTINSIVAFEDDLRRGALGGGMRALLTVVLVFGVAGCTDADWANVASFAGSTWDSSTTAHTDLPASTPSSSSPSSGNADPGCRLVASNRSSDVATQGFDADTQAAVYSRTYADCMAWAKRGVVER